jgi:hypothetical protein
MHSLTNGTPKQGIHTLKIGIVQRAESVGVIGLLIAALLGFALAPLALPESYSWVALGTSEASLNLSGVSSRMPTLHRPLAAPCQIGGSMTHPAANVARRCQRLPRTKVLLTAR